MQKKIVQSFFIVLLVLELSSAQSTTEFGECYRIGVLTCTASGTDPSICAFFAVLHCMDVPLYPGDDISSNYFCEFGCASLMCTDLSTKEDLAEKKVEDCVNSCSKRCGKI